MRGGGNPSLPFVSRSEYRLEGLLLRSGSLDLPVALPRPSSLLPDQGKDPPSGPGRAGKRPAGPRLRRRRRGGGAEERLHLLCLPIALQAEPTEFPFARRSVVPTLRIEAAHHSPRAASARRHRGSRPVHPGDASPRPHRPAPGPALTTRPGPAGRARRGGRRPLRVRDLRARRPPPSPARHPPAPPPPGGGSGGVAAVTRRPRGGKLRPPPAPPAAALPPPGTKETKPRRPGPAPLLPPPRPPGRPPPARRPGQAGSSRESRARGPEPPGTPHSSPPGSALAEGGGLDPSLARGRTVGGGEGRRAAPGGCQGNADGGGRSAPSRAAGPAAPPGPVPAGPHLRAALEPELGALRHGRGRTAGAGGWGSRSAPRRVVVLRPDLRLPACQRPVGPTPLTCPTNHRQPPPPLSGAPELPLTCPVPGSCGHPPPTFFT